jgi:hypothetical protein
MIVRTFGRAGFRFGANCRDSLQWISGEAREEHFVRDRNQYWFPAKRRGWGWGPPTVWQGWVVLIGILVANAVAAVVLMPRHVVEFLCFVFAMVLLMLLICSVKGEPPPWR